ncbi:MAG TPA: transglycosylase domain-containing protein [Aldersonia sp.]
MSPKPRASSDSSLSSSDESSIPTRHRRKKSPWRYVRRTLLVLLVLAIATPPAAFAMAYSRSVVPQPSDMRTNQVATIYASDGTSVVAKVVPLEGNRTDIPVDAVPVHVRDAVFAAEDQNFYDNPGFSISGFVRAARDNVLGREDAGGGSTITQQYVKNVLVGSDRTVERKLEELVIASKMAREWSKDEILAAYLNTIYFGRGAYGIAAASTAYFGKPVGELTVAEGAVLASVIRTPSGLDPETHLPELQARWNYVLDRMVAANTLPATDRAANEFPWIVPLNEVASGAEARGPEGLIRARVLEEIAAAGIDQEKLDTGGLQITTTIDTQAQDAAVNAVRSIFVGEPEELRSAVVSIDPHTGGVRAYYGGEDGAGFDFAQARLQTGSSFKVFGLVAALSQDIPLSKMYDSSELTVSGLRITNVDGDTCGTCTIAQALKQSLNTSFYRMTLSLDGGANAVADAAHAAGIPEHIPGVDGVSLSEPNGESEAGVVLGQYLVRPIDMASGYATLAASGIYHAPYFVQKVVDDEGNVLLDRGPSPGEQRIDPAVAENVTQAMLPIASYSAGHALASGRPSASKTGTAQLGDTGMNKDAWMVGYTPSLSTAVWIGTEQAQAITNLWGGSIYGSGLPADIWKKTMDDALDGIEEESFPWPDPVGGQAGVPPYSGATTTTRAPQAAADTYQPSAPVVPALPEIEVPVPLPEAPAAPRDVEILPGVVIPLPG